MSDETYNGWTNWATFFVCSTVDNIEAPYHKMRKTAMEGDISDVRKYAEELFFGTPDSDMHPSDLEKVMNARKDISQAEFETVNWEEAYENFAEE